MQQSHSSLTQCTALHCTALFCTAQPPLRIKVHSHAGSSHSAMNKSTANAENGTLTQNGVENNYHSEVISVDDSAPGPAPDQEEDTEMFELSNVTIEVEDEVANVGSLLDPETGIMGPPAPPSSPVSPNTTMLPTASKSTPPPKQNKGDPDFATSFPATWTPAPTSETWPQNDNLNFRRMDWKQVQNIFLNPLLAYAILNTGQKQTIRSMETEY